MSVLIIGAGAFGLSAALELRSRKYQVHVIDRAHILPAIDAASTDINKIIRMDYGGQRIYMELAHSAMKRWREWNREFPDDPYFVECGLLVLSEQKMAGPSFEFDSWNAIHDAGFAKLKRMDDPAKLEALFPSYKGKTMFKDGYWNPVGGYADSGLVMKRLYEKCCRAGVRFSLGHAGEFLQFIHNAEQDITGVLVKSGDIYYADKIILATGSWTGSFLTEPVLKACGQAVIHIKVPPSLREKYSYRNFPVFAYDIATTGYYGFPVHPKTGLMKIARHASGYCRQCETAVGDRSVPWTAVDDPNQTIPMDAYQELKTFVQKFFPDLAPLPFFSSRICWYSDSVDGDFIIDFVPGMKQVLVASGGSGHAFKFAPVLGELIADRLEGRTDNSALRHFKWREMTRESHTAERAQDTERSLNNSEMVDPRAFEKNVSRL